MVYPDVGSEASVEPVLSASMGLVVHALDTPLADRARIHCQSDRSYPHTPSAPRSDCCCAAWLEGGGPGRNRCDTVHRVSGLRRNSPGAF